MDNKVAHIGAEIAVAVVVSVYFSNKLKKHESYIEELSAKIQRLEQQLKYVHSRQEFFMAGGHGPQGQQGPNRQHGNGPQSQHGPQRQPRRGSQGQSRGPLPGGSQGRPPSNVTPGEEKTLDADDNEETLDHGLMGMMDQIGPLFDLMGTITSAQTEMNGRKQSSVEVEEFTDNDLSEELKDELEEMKKSSLDKEDEPTVPEISESRLKTKSNKSPKEKSDISFIKKKN
jgi:hypothetical protein